MSREHAIFDMDIITPVVGSLLLWLQHHFEHRSLSRGGAVR